MMLAVVIGDDGQSISQRCYDFERSLNVTKSASMFAFAFLICPTIEAVDPNPDLKEFQGHWEVTQLVEDGNVIPAKAIREWLPSGGKAEIIDNAIVFEAPSDGKKSVKLFSINQATYPKQIDVSTKDGAAGWGIYKFDEGKLIVCLSDPKEAARPGKFSAESGSKRMLMVLARSSGVASKPPEKVAQQPAPLVSVSDEEIAKLLVGTWKYQDSIGNLFAVFHADGSFSTTREIQEIRLFQRVFVQTPVSTGRWSVQNGKINFVVTTSTHWDRVNRQLAFVVRSISQNDLIFVDYLGQVGRAAKVNP